mmetsp:Transcript_70715/g.124750  ORF Transcript_70715/g.124750 Transcript_70715/m.124750 type:complete len:209 (+) Transcript_70715:262-888(+)
MSLKILCTRARFFLNARSSSIVNANFCTANHRDMVPTFAKLAADIFSPPALAFDTASALLLSIVDFGPESRSRASSASLSLASFSLWISLAISKRVVGSKPFAVMHGLNALQTISACLDPPTLTKIPKHEALRGLPSGGTLKRTTSFEPVDHSIPISIKSQASALRLSTKSGNCFLRPSSSRSMPSKMKIATPSSKGHMHRPAANISR